MTLGLLVFILCFCAGIFFIGRSAGKTEVKKDEMQAVLDDIGLAKRVREDEKKVIAARRKFTRVD